MDSSHSPATPVLSHKAVGLPPQHVIRSWWQGVAWGWMFLSQSYRVARALREIREVVSGPKWRLAHLVAKHLRRHHRRLLLHAILRAWDLLRQGELESEELERRVHLTTKTYLGNGDCFWGPLFADLGAPEESWRASAGRKGLVRNERVDAAVVIGYQLIRYAEGAIPDHSGTFTRPPTNDPRRFVLFP